MVSQGTGLYMWRRLYSPRRPTYVLASFKIFERIRCTYYVCFHFVLNSASLIIRQLRVSLVCLGYIRIRVSWKRFSSTRTHAVIANDLDIKVLIVLVLSYITPPLDVGILMKQREWIAFAAALPIDFKQTQSEGTRRTKEKNTRDLIFFVTKKFWKQFFMVQEADDQRLAGAGADM